MARTLSLGSGDGNGTAVLLLPERVPLKAHHRLRTNRGGGQKLHKLACSPAFESWAL